MQEASKKIVLILALCISFSGFTHPANGICASDSLTDSIHMSKSQKSNNLFRRIISYFDDTNKPKKKKRFDVSFIGGPHYSSDTRLGLGLMAAGNYYTKGDTTLMPSNVSLYSDLSTVGFYLIVTIPRVPNMILNSSLPANAGRYLMFDSGRNLRRSIFNGMITSSFVVAVPQSTNTPHPPCF